jgi:hypothetical protein
MSSSVGGTQLFGKIRGIIEKEVPGWRKAIYFFQPILEKKERTTLEGVSDFMSPLTFLLNNFIKGKKLDVAVINNFKSAVKKIKSQKLTEIKTEIIQNINDYPKIDASVKQEAINFIEALFGGKQLSVPSPNLIKIGKTITIYSTDLIDYVGMNQKSYGSSARTRIYRIIIKQMFGSKVNIKQIGDTTYFSLVPIPDDPEGVY